MNTNEHSIWLGWLSLILFGFSFVVPPVTIIGHEARRVGELDFARQGPARGATAVVVLAFGAFFTRYFHIAGLFAATAFVMAMVASWYHFQVCAHLHVGIILWIASILGLTFAGNLNYRYQRVGC
jgi:hypothetical protein